MALSKFSYLKSWIGKFRQCHGAYSMEAIVSFLNNTMPLLQHFSIRVYFPNISLQQSDPRINSLHRRHNERGGVSNDQPHDCLLNCLFRRRSKKTSKLGVTGLCAGNSLVTGEFPTQKASNAENVSIWWRHHMFMRVSGNMSTGRIEAHILHFVVISRAAMV